MYFRVITEPLFLYLPKHGHWVRLSGSHFHTIGHGHFDCGGDWELEAMVRVAAKGECEPEILADFIEERRPDWKRVVKALRECEQTGTRTVWD